MAPFHLRLLTIALLCLPLSAARAATDRVQAVVRKESVEHVLNALAASGGFNQGGLEYGVGYAVKISGFTLETSPADQKLYVSLLMNINTDFKVAEFDWGPNYTYKIRVAATLEETPTAPSGRGLTMCFKPESLRESYCSSNGSWIKCQAAGLIDNVIRDALNGLACVNLAALSTALPDLNRSWVIADHAPVIENGRIVFGYTIRPKLNRSCMPCILPLLLD